MIRYVTMQIGTGAMIWYVTMQIGTDAMIQYSVGRRGTVGFDVVNRQASTELEVHLSRLVLCHGPLRIEHDHSARLAHACAHMPFQGGILIHLSRVVLRHGPLRVQHNHGGRLAHSCAHMSLQGGPERS